MTNQPAPETFRRTVGTDRVWHRSGGRRAWFFLLAWAACAPHRSAVPDPGTDAPADLVLMGAVVHTMEPGAPRADAVAVRAGRIVRVGSQDAVQPFIGPGTTVHRLDGHTVLPGLHDSHMHLVWSATEREDVLLEDAATVDELVARVAAQAARAPGDGWVRGTGWDASRFEGQLHRSRLDAAAPGRLVYLASADGHSAWVSSAALALAGVTAATVDPPGGVIDRDAAGQPTGVLREQAMHLVSDLMPPYSAEQVDRGLAKALVEAASHGITSIIDPGVDEWMLAGYQRFADRGALTVRVHAAVKIDPRAGVAQLEAVKALRARYAGPLVRVNAVKLYVDGVIESRTAYMLAPYLGGGNGTPSFTDDALADIARAAGRAGLQLHAHVIGDGAVRQMLDVLERVGAAHRPLLAHVELVDPADVARFGTLGVYVVASPLWAYPDPYVTELTIPALGPERSRWLYPMAALERAGAVLVAGSDWSVSSMDPFDAMEVAVTRRAPDATGGPALAPQHAVPLAHVLAAYTINGARASFVEDELGSIAVGKRADLIVLDRDPFAVEPSELSELRVLRTFVDGREVYHAAP